MHEQLLLKLRMAWLLLPLLVRLRGDGGRPWEDEGMSWWRRRGGGRGVLQLVLPTMMTMVVVVLVLLDVE